MNDLQKGGTHYPRNEIRSELAIRGGNSEKYTVEDDSINFLELDKETQIKAKYFNYVTAYAYIMDLICGFVTDYRTVPKAIYDDPNSRYYKIRLKRETVEKYAIGPYTRVKSKFWKAFYKVIAEPKTLIMHTDEGNFLGEPIRILAKLTDGTILKKNFENLNNASQMIKSVDIEFFKPMFKQIVEDKETFVLLPPHLQAVIDTELLENPHLAEWKAYSNYKSYDPEKLTGQQIRLYFMYMADRNNDKGENMYIPDIEFWQTVHPDNVRVNIKNINDPFVKENYKGGTFPNAKLQGDKLFIYYLNDWVKSKYEMDALANFHSVLSYKGLLQGMNFTTCRSYYEKDNHRYRIAVYRKVPLQNAPKYSQLEAPKQNTIEDNSEYQLNIEYQKWLNEGNKGSFLEFCIFHRNTKPIFTPPENTNFNDIQF